MSGSSSSSSHSYIGKKIRPWEVDKIVDKKVVGGKVRYLVKWRRFNELNTWEISECFTDQSIIEKFERDWLNSQRSVRNALIRRSTGQSQPARNTLPAAAKLTVIKEVSDTNVAVKSPRRATIGSTTTSSQGGTLLQDVMDLMENELQCSICLDVYKKPCLTDCDHIFCDQCIEKWTKNQNATCPICRAELRRSQRKLTKIDNFIVKVKELSEAFSV